MRLTTLQASAMSESRAGEGSSTLIASMAISACTWASSLHLRSPCDCFTSARASSTSPGASNLRPMRVSSLGNSSAAKRVGAVAKPLFRSASGALPRIEVVPKGKIVAVELKVWEKIVSGVVIG